MNITLRPLTPEDGAVVWQMLMYAAHEASLEAVQTQPELARYAKNWGRSGDLGVGAIADDLPVGAAWVRLWSEADRGFAFVDPTIPELAMAVLPDSRGQGIGTKLLEGLLEAAQPLYPAISLNVRAENPVVNLYQRVGFVKIPGSEVINRTGGFSFNMICLL